MRFIASPIYRAFPELDVFTDEQCSRYVSMARGGQRSRVRFEVIRVVLTLGSVFVLCPVVLLNWDWSEAPWVIAVSVVMMVAVFCFGMLLWRDVLLRLVVRRALRQAAHCTSCGYGLVGLKVSSVLAAHCPECGTANDIREFREYCVEGTDGDIRYLPSPGLVHAGLPLIFYALARFAIRAVLAIVLIVGIVVLPVVVFVLAESWSARADRGALPTPEQRDAALRPPGTAPSTESIAAPLAEFALWELPRWLPEFQAAGKRMRSSPRTRWGDASLPEAIAKESVLQTLESRGLHQAEVMALAADRIAAGAGGSMLPAPIDTPDGKDWPRYAALPRLWRLANAAIAVAAERRDSPAFARAMEWQLAALRIHASTPPFMTNYEGLCPLVRVTAEALRAEGGEQLSSALAAAIHRQSVRPSMEAMKAATMDWELDELVSWFESPWGALRPEWSGPRTALIANSLNISWPGLYWPQRWAIRAHYGVLFEELMADPSERDQQKMLAEMAALENAGPINSVRFQGFAGAPLSGDLRGALFERGLATVVAIERFRRTEGHLPASLAELRPRFVDEVPKDPFRKGPFVYRVLPLDPTAAWHPGYTLWSVGVNGSDDDGNPVTDVVLVPPPPEPEPEPEPSADSPADPDDTLGN